MAVLHPGSWEAFRGWSPNGTFIPEDISEEILLILKREQLREIVRAIHEQYARGFRQEMTGDHVPYYGRHSLEIEEVRVHCSDCHPGRFSLDPDAGVQAVGRRTAFCCGGYVTSQKHRKLTPDIVRWDEDLGRRDILTAQPTGRKRVEGFQDVYFLGGLPLIYWTLGGQMGLKLLDRECVWDRPRHAVNWMWRGNKDRARYHLTDGLMAFGEYGDVYAKDIDIGTYTNYLQRREQNMIDGEYVFCS